MNDEWKEIQNYPDYIVSSDGEVASRKSPNLKILKPHSRKNGYLSVELCVDGDSRKQLVHVLVAETFLGPRPTPAHEVNHKNGVRSDNRGHNLEWVTRGENQRHRFDVLRHKGVRGEAHGRAKVSEMDVHAIRERVAAGERRREIAAEYGISPRSVGNIVRGDSWAWLTWGN